MCNNWPTAVLLLVNVIVHTLKNHVSLYKGVVYKQEWVPKDEKLLQKGTSVVEGRNIDY